MCIFSGDVESVSRTKIFARVKDGVQFLVYSMALETSKDVAMILPIPTPKGSPEDAVKFIDLSGYEDFFEDLESGFPRPITKGTRGFSLGSDSMREADLEVHEVGSFDASFVPTLRDFRRLDDRFKLPDEVWRGLPQYKDYGFVVFKFREGDGVAHPMAFSFPTAIPEKAFFPTVHVHDGVVHDMGDFDHVLYAQDLGETWLSSDEDATRFMDMDKCKGVLSESKVCKQGIRGRRKNVDQIVAARS